MISLNQIKWSIALLYVLAALVVCLYSCGPGASGPVAQLMLDDGSQYLVTQQWNDIGEPFAINFWYKPKDGRWGWCYIDHQDSRWRDGLLVLNAEEKSVQVFRGDILRAEYYIEKQSFALYYSNGTSRELPAPQEWRDPPGLSD